MTVTADSYGPFDAGPGLIVTDDQWSLYARQLLTNGVMLGELNQLLPFGDGSGMQMKIDTGNAFIQGFYGRWSTAVSVLGVAANTSGQTRIDLAVVRLNMTSKLLELDVKSGIPSVSPAPPSLQQDSTTWEEPLAQIRVASGTTSITSVMVTDARKFARARGIGLGRPIATFESAPANDAELFLQGQTLSRVTYAEIYAIPALVAGPGDNVSTFQVVDLRKHVLAGRLAGDPDFGGVLGARIGEGRHTMAGSELAPHSHGGTTGNETQNHEHGYAQPSGTISAINSDSTPAGGWAVKSTTSVWQAALANTGTTGGITRDHQHAIPQDGSGVAMPVIQPTVLVNYVIRAR